MNPENCVFSVMLSIRGDHPRRHVLVGLQEVVLRFEFHENRLSGFGAVGLKICPLSLIWPNQWENGQINGKRQISTHHNSETA